MSGFGVTVEDLEFLGEGLTRPECVLCTRKGALFVSDWDGGVTRIGLEGGQTRILARDAVALVGEPLRPNGIALSRDGSFLLAHLGDAGGGVFRLMRGGGLTPVLREVEGVPLPPTNFVLEDARGRIWATISSRRAPRHLGYRRGLAEGFVVLIDGAEARVVADGIDFTNEVQMHPSGDWLYVNETFGRRLSRFPLAADGALGRRETVAEFGAGTFPDGLAFDTEGAAWVVSIVCNRVIRVTAEGRSRVVLEDSDPEHLAWVEAAYRDGSLGRPHLDRIASRRLKNISSLAFGGPDRQTAFLGCLLGDCLASFRAPAPGVAPAHWELDV